MQSQHRRRLEKTASELGLHHFLWYLVNAHRFTNNVDYSIICFQKASEIWNLKVVPNDTCILVKELCYVNIVSAICMAAIHLFLSVSILSWKHSCGNQCFFVYRSFEKSLINNRLAVGIPVWQDSDFHEKKSLFWLIKGWWLYSNAWFSPYGQLSIWSHPQSLISRPSQSDLNAVDVTLALYIWYNTNNTDT